MQRFTALSGLLVVVVMSASPARADELVMLEQEGCSWCARWHAEIGPIYDKTDEGRRAPIRFVDINQPLPADLQGLRLDRFTPSFVLVDNGQEIGRIRGYPGDEFFWFLLDEMLDKADAERAAKHGGLPKTTDINYAATQ
jgi:hypothetical protein